MDISAAGWGAITAAAGAVTGNRYRENYDAHHLDPASPLAVLADGMGDGPGSAFASRTAVANFREAPVPSTPAALRQIVASIHASVRDFGRDLPALTGSTLTAFIGDAPGSAWLVQIGDSRAYRLRNGHLDLLTSDHTASWLGLLHGWFDHDSTQARAARYRLTRYLGHPDAPDPDILNVALLPGDVYLLCTDGVPDQLPYELLRDTLATIPTPSDAVRHILRATLTAGGTDNATAIVLRAPDTISVEESS